MSKGSVTEVIGGSDGGSRLTIEGSTVEKQKQVQNERVAGGIDFKTKSRGRGAHDSAQRGAVRAVTGVRFLVISHKWM